MAKKPAKKKMSVGGVAKKRNYRKEYDNYQSKPEQISKDVIAVMLHVMLVKKAGVK